jgi:hypothetical protein
MKFPTIAARRAAQALGGSYRKRTKRTNRQRAGSRPRSSLDEGSSVPLMTTRRGAIAVSCEALRPAEQAGQEVRLAFRGALTAAAALAPNFHWL